MNAKLREKLEAAISACADKAAKEGTTALDALQYTQAAGLDALQYTQAAVHAPTFHNFVEGMTPAHWSGVWTGSAGDELSARLAANGENVPDQATASK